MRREFHVRFWEGPGVRFPRATRLVLCFACEDDGKRVYTVLPKRFGRYGLQLHPTKTRLIAFRRPPGGPGKPCPSPAGHGTREAFDFLGFTHYWARSRRGYWVIKRKTASSRFSRAVRRLNQWLRRVRHERLIWQHQRLSQKLRGHYQYYGITGNSRCLARFSALAERLWLKWLRRRDQRGQRRTWTWFRAILARYPLPAPIAYHSTWRRVANP